MTVSGYIALVATIIPAFAHYVILGTKNQTYSAFPPKTFKSHLNLES